MLKRLTAIFFAALASIMLLAHSVVPHHHHGDAVCFELNHHHSCEISDQETCPEDHNKELPASTDGKCCVLDHLVMFHPESSRHDLETASLPAEKGFPVFLQDGLIAQNPDGIFSIPSLSFRQHPPQNTIHLQCTGHSHGLRAPPSV
ncbi:MAG: hypothetical protein K0B09_00650 [Bacteroidales bacterium]|nr:hypothetical protein [Bacteroidales bacterium]